MKISLHRSERGHGHIVLFFFVMLALVGLVGFKVYKMQAGASVVSGIFQADRRNSAANAVEQEVETGGGNTSSSSSAKPLSTEDDHLFSFDGVSYPKAGAGSKGASGGALTGAVGIAGGGAVAIKAGVAISSFHLKNLLKDTKVQRSSPGYAAGNRTYIVTVYGTKGGKKVALNGVGVTMSINAHVGKEQNGCQPQGSDQILDGVTGGIYHSIIRTVTGTDGGVAFSHCSGQQIKDLGFDHIPEGYGKPIKASGGGYAAINAKGESAKIIVTLSDATAGGKKPTAVDLDECVKDAIKKAKQPGSGSGMHEGDSVENFGTDETNDRAAWIHFKHTQFKAPKVAKGGSKDCEEKSKQSFNYTIQFKAMRYPARRLIQASDMAGVEVNLTDHIKCEDPAEHRKADAAGAAHFNNCTGGLDGIYIESMPLQVGTPKDNYQVVERISSNGYVTIKTTKTKSNINVLITVKLQNEAPKITAVERQAIIEGTNNYWRAQKVDKGTFGINDHEAERCQPKDVVYTYYNQDEKYKGGSKVSDDSLAKANLGGALHGNNCVIQWNRNVKFGFNKLVTSATGRCAVGVHEYGHLLLNGHSTNPHDIMAPSLTKETIAASKCGKSPASKSSSTAQGSNSLAPGASNNLH